MLHHLQLGNTFLLHENVLFEIWDLFWLFFKMRFWKTQKEVSTPIYTVMHKCSEYILDFLKHFQSDRFLACRARSALSVCAPTHLTHPVAIKLSLFSPSFLSPNTSVHSLSRSLLIYCKKQFRSNVLVFVKTFFTVYPYAYYGVGSKF